MNAPRSCNQVRVGPLLKKKQRQMVSACGTVLHEEYRSVMQRTFNPGDGVSFPSSAVG